MLYQLCCAYSVKSGSYKKREGYAKSVERVPSLAKSWPKQKILQRQFAEQRAPVADTGSIQKLQIRTTDVVCIKVWCHACNPPIANKHYHYSSCNDGRFNMWVDCTSEGRHCLNGNHELVKRHRRVERPRANSQPSQHQTPKVFVGEKKQADLDPPKNQLLNPDTSRRIKSRSVGGPPQSTNNGLAFQPASRLSVFFKEGSAWPMVLNHFQIKQCLPSISNLISRKRVCHRRERQKGIMEEACFQQIVCEPIDTSNKYLG